MKTPKRSPLALAVLALLIEAPMHPYRMQQLLKSRGKEDVINIRQRASLYQTIERLQREELIAAGSVERGEGRPERTIYRITSAGRGVAVAWLREMIAEPQSEYPEFPVALSFLAMLTAAEAMPLLETRLAGLKEREASLAAGLETYRPIVPRLLLLENEYMLATVRTERAWIDAVISDLRSGALRWDIAELKAAAVRLEGTPPKPG
jgi:DNA-binding PadR family transcriptional regulator